jgi:hypothetical protein
MHLRCRLAYWLFRALDGAPWYDPIGTEPTRWAMWVDWALTRMCEACDEHYLGT